jgi:hypothetical protein
MKSMYHAIVKIVSKLRRFVLFSLLLALLGGTGTMAQVNSGSDGHDGVFNPTTSTVIDMANHPDGIYHYTSVNIPVGIPALYLAA